MPEPMFPPEVEQALSYTVTLSEIVSVIVIFDIAALLALMFLERYDPRVFVTWLVMLVLAPPVGFILYMYLGATIYNRMRFMPKNVTDTQLMTAAEYQSNLLEEDLGGDPEKAEMYRMAKCMDRSGAWSYSDDNEITLFTEGHEKLSSLLNDLRSAEKSILMEYYIIRNDEIGNELMDILTQKVREGVEVRLLTDAFGIGKGPKEGIFRFRNAGGHYATFHSSLNLLLSPKKNNRNHRKIAIIDGKMAYCGGFNIGNEYQGEGPLGHWRDASVKVVGSGILPMAVRFSADWQYCAKRDPLKPLGHYLGEVTIPHKGNVRMQLVSGGPDTMPNNPVQMQYLAMIANAKRRLYITTPYLAPDESMILALANAARSGVDVRILIPDKKDHMFLFWNNMVQRRICPREAHRHGRLVLLGRVGELRHTLVHTQFRDQCHDLLRGGDQAGSGPVPGRPGQEHRVLLRGVRPEDHDDEDPHGHFQAHDTAGVIAWTSMFSS